MKQFMDENFLLETKTAQDLFHNHATKMPIIDYHCHLNPEMVANDHKFGSITELWLGGDHYKWRAMRTNGVDEKYCTGKETSDWEKFEKWAETVPYCFRNPLYHWTHLELKTAFGIDKILNPSTAREIFDECNEKLKQPEFSARGLMRHYHVETVCTTDDPVDDLHYHQQTREDGFEVKMIPAWRPDKAMAVENPTNFIAYIEKLGDLLMLTSVSLMTLSMHSRSVMITSQPTGVNYLIMVSKSSMLLIIQILRLKLFLRRLWLDRLFQIWRFDSSRVVCLFVLQRWMLTPIGHSNFIMAQFVTTIQRCLTSSVLILVLTVSENSIQLKN